MWIGLLEGQCQRCPSELLYIIVYYVMLWSECPPLCHPEKECLLLILNNFSNVWLPICMGAEQSDNILLLQLIKGTKCIWAELSSCGRRSTVLQGSVLEGPIDSCLADEALDCSLIQSVEGFRLNNCCQVVHGKPEAEILQVLWIRR